MLPPVIWLLRDYDGVPPTGGALYSDRVLRYITKRTSALHQLDRRAFTGSGVLRQNLRYLRSILALGAGIVVSDGYHHYSPLCLTAWLLKRRGYRHVVLVQALHNTEGLSQAQLRIHKLVMRTYLRSSDLVIVNSQYTRSALRDLYSLESTHPVAVISPVGQSWAHLAASRPTSTKRANTIVSVGNIQRKKGQHILIEALHLLRREHADASLWIAGMVKEPRYEAELRAAIESAGLGTSVRFLGFLTGEALAAVYQQATVFAHPSLWEELGLAIMEAQHWGLPVVASDVGGIPEVVSNEMDGLLVPPGDPISLYDALNRLLVDHHLSGRLSGAGRLRAEHYPKWDDVCKVFYDALLAVDGVGPENPKVFGK